jgi:hypothetical protein
MPLALTTFFQTPSLSQGGTCKCNLRGKILYDYVNENAGWVSNNPLSYITVVSSPWSSFIPYAFSIGTSDAITRGSIMSTKKKDITFMFRFYASSIGNPSGNGNTIFFNGTPGSPGLGVGFWGILIQGADPSTATFNFLSTYGEANFQSEVIASDIIQANTWYHIAFTIREVGVNNTFKSYLNGVNKNTNNAFPDIDTPTGNTVIGALIIPQTQNFQITDIVFLEKVLTDNEIAAYANSPYI